MTRKLRGVLGSLALAHALVAFAPGMVSAQRQQEELQNLQFFSADITRDSLIEVMRGFSFALGVRCQYCHTGGDGVSFEGVVFESDEDPDKGKARFMLRMVETLNTSMLPLMADRDEPGYEMSCKSCHRGRPKPLLLTEELRRTLDELGADSAVAQYRALREEVGMDGMFDFSEWEMNVLGERLTKEGRYRDAIAIFRVNSEFFPQSISIVLSLADLHERIEEVDAAIRFYERSLEISPDNRRATARLAALRGSP